jgi:hypothetical protein
MTVYGRVVHYRSDTKHGTRTQIDRADGSTYALVQKDIFIQYTATHNAPIFMAVQGKFIVLL